MSWFKEIAEGLRQAILLAERVDQAAKAAADAKQMAQENRERLIRLETMAEMAGSRVAIAAAPRD